MEKGFFMLFKIKKRKRNSDKMYGLKRECACNEVLSRNTDSSISIYWYCTPTPMRKTSNPVKPIRSVRGGGGSLNRLSHYRSLAQNEVLRNHQNNIGWLTFFKIDSSHFLILFHSGKVSAKLKNGESCRPDLKNPKLLT